MKHVTTGTQGGTGRLRTHLIKCSKEFARLDVIERANRNGISIPKNSMGVGGSNMVQNNASNNLKAIDYLKCILCLIDNDSFHIKCATHVYNLIVKDTKIKARITEFKNRYKECRLEYRKVPKEVCTR
ncbi:hypothetical protein H5410_039322 [Solanum commersonii]|uniref:Uncharacterized protein n=1 Tax=Solanum commersonii TaxID=4109 RepID=A0A9J5YD16_SOLCO|nr:hypothetical protein H5410_039322 [Solanum commersonii]